MDGLTDGLMGGGLKEWLGGWTEGWSAGAYLMDTADAADPGGITAGSRVRGLVEVG